MAFLFVSASNELRMFLGAGSGCYHADSLKSCIRHPSVGVGNYHTEITVQYRHRNYRAMQTQKLPYRTVPYRHRNYRTVQTQKLPYYADTEITVPYSTVQTQKLPYRTDTEITVQTQKLP